MQSDSFVGSMDATTLKMESSMEAGGESSRCHGHYSTTAESQHQWDAVKNRRALVHSQLQQWGEELLKLLKLADCSDVSVQLDMSDLQLRTKLREAATAFADAKCQGDQLENQRQLSHGFSAASSGASINVLARVTAAARAAAAAAAAAAAHAAAVAAAREAAAAARAAAAAAAAAAAHAAAVAAARGAAAAAREAVAAAHAIKAAAAAHATRVAARRAGISAARRSMRAAGSSLGRPLSWRQQKRREYWSAHTPEEQQRLRDWQARHKALHRRHASKERRGNGAQPPDSATAGRRSEGGRQGGKCDRTNATAVDAARMETQTAAETEAPQEPSAGLTPPAHDGAPAAGGDCRSPPAVAAAAAPPSLWAAAVAWVRGADWGGEAPVTLLAHQQVRVHLRLGSGGFGVLGAAPRACAAFAARTLECMGPALAAFPVAARSRVLEHARYGFTFTQIATCLQQLRSGSDDAAAALALLLPSVWYQDWRQDDGAWRALRDLLQRAGGAAGLGMRTRAGARRAAPAAAREPGSAQAPPAAVLPRRQAALSRVLDAALAATQLRRLEAANALEAVAAWRSGASKGAMGFLAQLPSTDPAKTMSPPEFRETLRRHLGVERPASAAARCPKCHKTVESGAHLRRCTQGLHVTRHNLLADALFQLLKQVAHLRGLDRDTLAPFRRYAARHGFNKFMDIVFGSNQICLPVPKVQPSADAAQGGARDVQRVLESASQEKIDTYVVSGALDPTTHTLFSAAFDHFGAMSRDTQALLHALAEQSSQGSYNLAQRVAFWRRRASLALQRALTRVVIDNWNAVIAPDGDVSAYRRIALLQVPRPSPASAEPPAPP
ncbi:hypothetical protein JKP88DRAFT_288811 [Tribonema minus]|uniref:Uncharacterized protein n=1 Tax=Tribonema minus TaxID=303371 RepID=A0A835Z351_9STRA|nr:hypothetical protein JKP88DRAFT_288811 [Tribonema minus]